MSALGQAEVEVDVLSIPSTASHRRQPSETWIGDGTTPRSSTNRTQQMPGLQSLHRRDPSETWIGDGTTPHPSTDRAHSIPLPATALHRRDPSETWIGDGTTPRHSQALGVNPVTPRHNQIGCMSKSCSLITSWGQLLMTSWWQGHTLSNVSNHSEDGEEFIGDDSKALIGGRTALQGEKIISQIDDYLQLTNYRVILCQSTEYCVRRGGVGIDAWIKDVSCVEIVKERFNPILLSVGLLLILGGVVNYEDLGLHVSNDFQIGINMAPIGFYLMGLAVLIVAQCLRRTCLTLGVLGQVDKTSFQVAIKESDIFMVNEMAGSLRRIQAPYSVLRHVH